MQRTTNPNHILSNTKTTTHFIETTHFIDQHVFLDFHLSFFRVLFQKRSIQLFQFSYFVFNKQMLGWFQFQFSSCLKADLFQFSICLLMCHKTESIEMLVQGVATPSNEDGIDESRKDL